MYFDNEENVERLRQVLNSWLGTPFRHRAAVKGVGCDCVHFIVAVMVELGVVKREDIYIPPYARDAGWHNYNDDMTRYMDKVEQLEKVGPPYKNGDILLVKFVNVPTHEGIYCDGLMYHSIWHSGVTRMSFTDPLITEIYSAYRVK